MSDNRKKFACPGCSKTVKVPFKHLGRKVQCPKCAFVFRAGDKLDEEEIVAELDDDLDLLDYVPQMPPVTYAAPPMPLANQQPVGLPPTMPQQVLPTKSRPKQRTRSKLPVHPSDKRDMMTESDKNLQSSGIFLLVLPVIATVLPLFGLQLRRLRRAGPFAPIAAMFLGLIGVGMICYARRKQGDAPLIGSAAAVFVLLSGIGGFFIVNAMTKEPDSEYSQYVDDSNEADGRIQDGFADNEPEADFRDQVHQDMQQQMEDARRESERMQRESEQAMQEALDNHRREMDKFRNQNNFSPPDLPQPSFPGPPDFPRPNFGRPPGFGGRRN
jgi:hypothetical protein